MKPTNTRKPAQARKRDLVIPPDRIRDRLADEVEALDCKSAEAGWKRAEARFQMGKKLIKLKKRLKTKRLWLAYLKMRKWSRAEVERLIVAARYPLKAKLLKLSSLGLPWSSLQALAARDASAAEIDEIESLSKAGVRVRVPPKQIRSVAYVTQEPSYTKEIKSVVYVTQEPSYTEQIKSAAKSVVAYVTEEPSPQVVRFRASLRQFASDVRYGGVSPEQLAETQGENGRAELAEDASAIATYMSALSRHVSPPTITHEAPETTH